MGGVSPKRLLLPSGLLLLALAVVGLVTGVVGAQLRGGEPILPTPEISLAAEPVFHIGPVGITNTVLSSWLTTIVLVLLFGLATRRMRLVPRGLQNVIEALVEALYDFVVSVAGEAYGRKFFPLIATIFLFVAFNAWLALLPIYPSVGYLYPEGSVLDGQNVGGHVQIHLLRSAGTDLNMPLALALVSFVFVEAWGLRAHGIRYLGEFIRVKGLVEGLRHLSPSKLFMGLIDAFTGVLEILSHGTRILSFTFRLFGNMTAGEILLLMMTYVVSFVATTVFYGLELFVGFVQALIFAGLTLAFVVVAVAPHEEEEAAHEEVERAASYQAR